MLLRKLFKFLILFCVNCLLLGIALLVGLSTRPILEDGSNLVRGFKWLDIIEVEELIGKEETQEKLMLKFSTVVDCFKKKLSGKEVENCVASHEQKLAALRKDVVDLLETIDEFSQFVE